MDKSPPSAEGLGSRALHALENPGFKGATPFRPMPGFTMLRTGAIPHEEEERRGPGRLERGTRNGGAFRTNMGKGASPRWFDAGAARSISRMPPASPPLRLSETFGVRSPRQVLGDLGEIVRDGLRGRRFQVGLSSAGLLRPRLSLPAYAGRVPRDGLAPIYNLFDRTGGGMFYSQRVSRARCRDYRGGRLSYDEHDGVDFVCPVGTPLVAAAAGTVVMLRDRWLRGGLTVGVDHGAGVITHYTHCARSMVSIGQPVRRGEVVALSGAAGIDLVQFFPWVPPHIHFMAWHHGRPVDPFERPGETSKVPWSRRNTPSHERPSDHEAIPHVSAVDAGELERATRACADRTVRRELEALANVPAAWAATLEDALHHQREAWGFQAADFALRPPSVEAGAVRLTLPLSPEAYRGARFGDTGGVAGEG